MISAMYNGISGLDSFQKALNVESNNIANVNTVGYKSDRINFTDLMYQDRIGKGSATQTVQKDFTNGKLTVDEYARLNDMLSRATANLEDTKVEYFVALKLLEETVGVKIKIGE